MSKKKIDLFVGDLANSRRILAYLHGTAPYIPSFVQPFKYFKESHGLEVVIVTLNIRTKLSILKEGLLALTIDELTAQVSSGEGAAFPEEVLDSVSEYDRTVRIKDAREEREKERITREERSRARDALAGYVLLFDAVRPSAVFTWNGAMTLESAPVHLARERGIPVFFMERGLLPHTIVVDPEGVNYASHLAGEKYQIIEAPEPDTEEKEKIRQYCATIKERGESIVSGGRRLLEEEVREALGIGPDRLIVLFPLQIERDSNILFNSPFYKTMPEIIRALQEAMIGIDNAVLVIRPHPEDKDRLPELKALCKGNTILDTELDLRSLLNAVDVVVTINSTVGLEALIDRKPVVALGNAVYTAKGFTFDLEQPDLLAKRLEQALEATKQGGLNEQDFHRFLLYILKNHLFALDEQDVWGSRERIASRVLKAASLVPERPIGISPQLKTLISENLEAMEMLERLEPGKSDLKSVLLVAPSPEDEEFIASQCNADIDSLTRDNAWSRLIPYLLKRYDYALNFETGSIKRKALWRLVRGDKKIQV